MSVSSITVQNVESTGPIGTTHQTRDLTHDVTTNILAYIIKGYLELLALAHLGRAIIPHDPKKGEGFGRLDTLRKNLDQCTETKRELVIVVGCRG